MNERRLFLFSGMGGDARLFREIRVAGIELITPDHVEPKDAEDLVSYATRLVKQYDIRPLDVVGGASFGGMLAAQMTALFPVAGLVLLGSCYHPRSLPQGYRLAERVGRLIPDFVLGLRSWRPLVRWRFAPVTEHAEECLLAMAATCSTLTLRRFGAMLVEWRGVETLSCPKLSVHGAWDRMIPAAQAEADLILSDAGHAFTLTHAKETNAAIEVFLARLREDHPSK